MEESGLGSVQVQESGLSEESSGSGRGLALGGDQWNGGGYSPGDLGCDPVDDAGLDGALYDPVDDLGKWSKSCKTCNRRGAGIVGTLV
jgi:hypothetical protein